MRSRRKSGIRHIKHICFALAASLCIAVACTAEASSQSASIPLPQSIWVHQESKWRYLPVDAYGREEHRIGGGSLLLFDADETFYIVNCLIVDTGTGLLVSRSDPISVYVGSWTRVKDGLDVEYSRLWSRGLAERLSEQPVRTRIGMTEAGVLKLDGREFKATTKIRRKEIEDLLSSPLTSHSQP